MQGRLGPYHSPNDRRFLAYDMKSSYYDQPPCSLTWYLNLTDTKKSGLRCWVLSALSIQNTKCKLKLCSNMGTVEGHQTRLGLGLCTFRHGMNAWVSILRPTFNFFPVSLVDARERGKWGLKSQLKTTKMLGTNYKYLQCEELTEPGLSPRLSRTGKLRELRDNVHSRLYRLEGGVWAMAVFPGRSGIFVLKLKSGLN